MNLSDLIYGVFIGIIFCESTTFIFSSTVKSAKDNHEALKKLFERTEQKFSDDGMEVFGEALEGTADEATGYLCESLSMLFDGIERLF